MSSQSQNLDFSDNGPVFIPAFFETKVSLGEEVRSDLKTTFPEENWWFTGMAKASENISDVVVKRLKAIPHVKAILMGRSGDIYHVWTMIDEWTIGGRKAVYAAQKELLLKLKGFDLDFYVVALDDGGSPGGLVSEIPTVFQRA
jgi:hypothetical protein